MIQFQCTLLLFPYKVIWDVNDTFKQKLNISRFETGHRYCCFNNFCFYWITSKLTWETNLLHFQNILRYLYTGADVLRQFQSIELLVHMYHIYSFLHDLNVNSYINNCIIFCWHKRKMFRWLRILTYYGRHFYFIVLIKRVNSSIILWQYTDSQFTFKLNVHDLQHFVQPILLVLHASSCQDLLFGEGQAEQFIQWN